MFLPSQERTFDELSKCVNQRSLTQETKSESPSSSFLKCIILPFFHYDCLIRILARSDLSVFVCVCAFVRSFVIQASITAFAEQHQRCLHAAQIMNQLFRVLHLKLAKES